MSSGVGYSTNMVIEDNQVADIEVDKDRAVICEKW